MAGERSKALIMPPQQRKWLHMLTAALSAALFVAAGEVVLRFLSCPEDIQERQVILAASSNAALLGMAAVLVVAIGMVAGRLVRKAAANRDLPTQLHSGLLGVTVALLLVLSELMGLGQHHLGVVVLCALAAGAGTWWFAAQAETLGKLLLSPGASVAAVAVWLLCLGYTVVLTAQTSRHLAQWVHIETPAQTPAAEDTPNIVLVVLDTLRADHVGVYGGGNLTPNLDQLAESSIVFTNAISTAPWTLPAHASLFTGLYPLKHRVSWGNICLDNSWPTLAELLKASGYDTFAISNNKLVCEETGYARGFDSFIATPKDPFLSQWRLALQCGAARWAIGWIGLSRDVAYDTGSSWTNWLLTKKLNGRSAERPFFLFLNYMESHDPYRPPERYVQRLLTPEQRKAYRRLPQKQEYFFAHGCGVPGLFSDDQIDLMKVLYGADVAYQDEVVGELLQLLRSNEFLANSWVVVTSDHGERFGEGNMLHHVTGSHYKLLHVPLIVRPPGGSSGTRSAAPAQPVDIFVTLLHAAGVEVPSSVRHAYHLPLQEDDPHERTMCVAQTFGAAIRSLEVSQKANQSVDLTRWLTWLTSIYYDDYLLEVDSLGPRGLFNVHDDPDMRDNLIETWPEVVKNMLDRFDQESLTMYRRGEQ